jgi:phenylacetate-CoA ligase
MAFQFKKRVYESLPISVKRMVGLIPFSWWAGSVYRTVYRRGLWFDRANRHDLREYQEQKLGEVLRFVVDQVPAYQSLRAVVDRRRPFEALKAFPFLDKDAVQADCRKYLPSDFDRIPHYEATTGGTSGNQLRLYLDDKSQSIDMAFMHRQWQRVGYTPGCRKATFRGVSFRHLGPGIYWQENPIYNELQFSPFHMAESNLHAYVEQIIRYTPSYFHGYPSAIDILAEFVLRQGLSDRLPRIEAALLGSEGATAAQRERIEQAFRTRVYSWYGHSERVVLAGECETSGTYHHFPDYGILEIIDDNGNSCEHEGERGEIVGTGLLNRSLPLIRYRTGDYATRCESRCECGRHWDRFTDVEGRWHQDMIIGRNGARISVAALNMHGPLFECVRRYQYVQDEVGKCALNVMVAPSFGDADRAAIQKAYESKTGDEVLWMVKEVDDIPLTVRGKLRLLLSSIVGKP